jgi:hypothetical protein
LSEDPMTGLQANFSLVDWRQSSRILPKNLLQTLQKTRMRRKPSPSVETERAIYRFAFMLAGTSPIIFGHHGLPSTRYPEMLKSKELTT